MKANRILFVFFPVMIFFQSCEWVNNLVSKNKTSDQNAVIVDEKINPNKDILYETKTEINEPKSDILNLVISDFIKDVYLMANIKSINSVNSIIKCEILFFIEPKSDFLPELNFSIFNQETNKVFLDTTILLQQNMPGVRYLANDNLFEINLGLKELGKNFKTRVSIPSLKFENYLDVEPKKYNEIFKDK